MIDELRRRAAPMRIAILAVSASNAAEAYYISGLGTEALAVYGKMLPLLLLLDALGIGLGAGASSVYARQHANPRCQPSVAVASLLLSFVIMTALALALWLAAGSVLLALGLKGQAIVVAKGYLLATLAGSVFLVVNATACALMRASDHSRTAAIVTVAGAILTMLLTPLFIYGRVLLPELGLAGAAWAHTFGAVAISCLLLLASLPRAANSTHLRQLLLALPQVWRRVLEVAVPAVLANAMVPLGVFFTVQLLITYSEAYVAAYSLALRLEALCLLSFYAYSSVAGPVFGQRLLPSPMLLRVEQLQQCARLCLKRGMLVALIALPLPLTFPLWLSCSTTLPALSEYFWLVPASYCAYGFVMVANAAFNGIGAPLRGLGVSFSRCLGILLPTAWLFAEALGPTGIFIAISVSNCLSAVLAYRLLRSTLQADAKPEFTIVSPNP